MPGRKTIQPALRCFAKHSVGDGGRRPKASLINVTPRLLSQRGGSNCAGIEARLRSGGDAKAASSQASFETKYVDPLNPLTVLWRQGNPLTVLWWNYPWMKESTKNARWPTMSCPCITPCNDQGDSSWCYVGPDCKGAEKNLFGLGPWKYCDPKIGGSASRIKSRRPRSHHLPFLN